MRHTPGPWKCNEYGFIKSPNGCIVAQSSRMGDKVEETVANGFVIAAAPALLAAAKEGYDALRDIINAADNGEPYNPKELQGSFQDAANQLYAAIAQAEEVNE